jgi:hypothetical protein
MYFSSYIGKNFAKVWQTKLIAHGIHFSAGNWEISPDVVILSKITDGKLKNSFCSTAKINRARMSQPAWHHAFSIDRLGAIIINQKKQCFRSGSGL